MNDKGYIIFKMIKNLFNKTFIRKLYLKNRFVRSSTWMNMADGKGHLTDRLSDIYKELAKGQIGLIITGNAFIKEDERCTPGKIGIYSDSFIKEYQELTELVHKFESKIIMQIGYGGTQTNYNVGNRTIWGPSPVPEMSSGVLAKEISKKEISEIIKLYGHSAIRVKKANFDGIQIHAAHGYFLSQFLNPYHNQRNDEYGGDIKNRARIIFEIYDEIRGRVGKDFLISIKINCRDFVKKELTFKESLYVCKELGSMGIDAIEVSGGIQAAKELGSIRPFINSPKQEAYFKEYAIIIAEKIKTPVILVGGLRSIEVMENLLLNSKIKYFALSRPFIREPNLIERWIKGDRNKSKCISCNKCRTPLGNVCLYTQPTYFKSLPNEESKNTFPQNNKEFTK